MKREGGEVGRRRRVKEEVKREGGGGEEGRMRRVKDEEVKREGGEMRRR